MKHIRKLFELFNEEQPFYKRYPNLDMDDGKIHVLYISPYLNPQGYYRMIVPCLELNKTKTHSAVCSTIQRYNFTKAFDQYDNNVDYRLIEWADYVVLPAQFSSVDYILRSLLDINPDLQFAMDIDTAYHHYPAEHPEKEKMSKEDLDQLLGNISKMDIALFSTGALLDAYQGMIEKRCAKRTVNFAYQPSLISRHGLEEVDELLVNNSDGVRIGIIGTGASYFDILCILEVLQTVQQKYGDQVELILFGWNGRYKGEDYLKDLEFSFCKSVQVVDYSHTLNSLRLDIALLPLADNTYNQLCKSPTKYLELSALAIPVVASNCAPYDAVIHQNETGMLANNNEEWLEDIETLIEEKAMRKRIGKAALKMIWEDYSYRDTDHLQAIFSQNEFTPLDN